jgi:hypothetical protein
MTQTSSEPCTKYDSFQKIVKHPRHRARARAMAMLPTQTKHQPKTEAVRASSHRIRSRIREGKALESSQLILRLATDKQRSPTRYPRRIAWSYSASLSPMPNAPRSVGRQSRNTLPPLFEQLFDIKRRRGKPPDPQRRDSASLHSAPISRQKASSRQSRPQCFKTRPGLYIHYRIKIFFQYLRDAQCRNVRIYPI